MALSSWNDNNNNHKPPPAKVEALDGHVPGSLREPPSAKVEALDRPIPRLLRELLPPPSEVVALFGLLGEPTLVNLGGMCCQKKRESLIMRVNTFTSVNKMEDNSLLVQF